MYWNRLKFKSYLLVEGVMRNFKFLLILFVTTFITLNSCSYNVSGLPETSDESCGNGVIDEGEDCEPYINFNKSCTELGFTSGSVGCNEDCTFDISTCANSCGECEVGVQKCQSNKIFTCATDASGC